MVWPRRKSALIVFFILVLLQFLNPAVPILGWREGDLRAGCRVQFPPADRPTSCKRGKGKEGETQEQNSPAGKIMTQPADPFFSVFFFFLIEGWGGAVAFSFIWTLKNWVIHLIYIKLHSLVSHSVMSNSFATAWTIACQASLSVEFSRQETGVASHSLLQGIFPTQGSNLDLLHCRQISLPSEPQGKP